MGCKSVTVVGRSFKTTLEVIVDKSDSEHGDDDGDENSSDSSEVFVDV